MHQHHNSQSQYEKLHPGSQAGFTIHVDLCATVDMLLLVCNLAHLKIVCYYDSLTNNDSTDIPLDLCH